MRFVRADSMGGTAENGEIRPFPGDTGQKRNDWATQNKNKVH
jgi:hypothetical protein